MSHRHQGFSSVELLITLFIAAVFVIAGYLVWIQVVKAAADSDQLARASNVSYEYMRRNMATACTTSSPQNITVAGLANVSVLVNVTCPYSGSGAQINTIRKIKSTVRYGDESPQKEVTHATLVN